MKYDDASWHYGGDNFPADHPDEYGATHIALFLKWCFVKGWAGDLHLQEQPEAVQHVIKGEMTATEFLFSYCDGKFTSEDLNEEGQAFAAQYYGDDGLYLYDYTENFDDLGYSGPETMHDFNKFSMILEERFNNGILTKSQIKPKAWWKVW